MTATRHEGCTCRPTIMAAGKTGAFTVEHEDRCALPRTLKLERAARQAARLANSPRGKMLDRLTGGGRG